MSVKAIHHKRDKVRKLNPKSEYHRRKTKWVRASIYLTDWYNLHLLRNHWSDKERVSMGQAMHRLITEKLKSLKIDPVEPGQITPEGRIVGASRETLNALPLPAIFDEQANRNNWRDRLVSVPEPVTNHIIIRDVPPLS